MRIDAVIRPFLGDTRSSEYIIDSFLKSTIYWLYNKFTQNFVGCFLISLVMNKSYATGCDAYTYGLNCKKMR